MAFVGLNQKELQKVLAICNQISPRHGEVDVFTYTRVCLRKDAVEISCFNSNLFFRTTLTPLNIDLQAETESVEFLTKTDLLTSSVNLIKDEVVSLTVDLQKATLVLQSSVSKHTLRINLDQIDNFISPEKKPQSQEARLTVDAPALLNANKLAQIAVGQPRLVYQPEFLHICYSLMLSENSMAVVSTDRYRMVKTVLDVQVIETTAELQTTQKDYLVSPKNLSILSSLVDAEAPLDLVFEKEALWVKFQQSEMVLRYGEGTYPEYNRILPQSFACSFVVNTKDALEALRQVFYLARMNPNNKSVTLAVDPTKKQLTFSTSLEDGCASESSVSLLEYEGSEESWSQSFNAEYLLDYIAVVPTERLLWEANPSKPSLLSPENQKAQQLYLVSGLK